MLVSIGIRLAASHEHVMFTIDGQWGTSLGPGDSIEISQASTPLRLFRSTDGDGYFDVLTSKLHWGEREVG